MRRPTRLGPLPLLHALFASLHLAALVGVITKWPTVVMWVVAGEGSLWIPIAGFETLTVLSAIIAIIAMRRARQSQAGVSGRSRVSIAVVIHLLYLLLLHFPLGILMHGASEAVSSGFSFTFGLDEARLALTDVWRQALTYGVTALAVIAVADLLGRTSLWFLLPRRFRGTFWFVIDVGLIGGLVWVTVKLPLEPAREELAALQEPIIRLVVTALFAIRVFARVVPPAMSGIEKLGFLPLIASRHLRSKKSGFLAAISSLSIGAVAVSTCMLVGVLSVMGGFRNDLKEKILGNHAHALVDAGEHNSFEGWDPVLAAAREAPGVIAATPFVSGEVMLTSASNRAGAVLRGIEPSSLSNVTRIESYLERGRGKLDYLIHPERLLDLPPEERRTILPLEIEIEDDGDGSLVREIEEELREPEEPEEVEEPLEDIFRETNIDPSGREVLPGIVLGKELARTLRVFLGDDVHVVSPMGELGPAGPMPKARRFRVAGIFYSGMYEYDMKLVYVLLPRAQRFLSTGDAITGIEIKVEEVDDAPEVARAVDANITALGRTDLRVRDWQETNQGLFGALELEKLAMFITLGIAILIAGFCVFGTLTLMVQEKGREVGILFAMGTTPRGIVSIFMLEGFLIGLYGAGIGLGLGYVVTFAFEHFGIRLNPEVYYIDRLPVHVDATEFTLVGIVALGMCVVATIFPAVLASRTKPVDAIRYQ